ncbi:hypothetical protein C9374_009346 [Naegleria lovaniensis]|uniref:CN hydrolase domain-containing protein n=1 Tax=Naegleria lovaniensis TaxID=51637 RepID=A0AA88GII8_NAELO|nr:uncharacterized protein C9374_009346 [Naegleria lovaniensis]KAG2377435.1 hypothetical protein C9374_009346 [Naegleria lovaniensis]
MNIFASSSSRCLRVAFCQYNIQLKQVKQNQQKVTEMLGRYISKKMNKNDSVDPIISPSSKCFDILIFPEMSFTGYLFENRKDVFPYCEEKGKGSCYEFCWDLARKYHCAVVCGYPEKEPIVNDHGSSLDHHDLADDESIGNHYKLFNSMYIVSPDGSFVNYRKHFLYCEDLKWANEGEGFKTFDFSLTEKKVQVVNNTELNSTFQHVRIGLGICMDINNGTNFSSDFKNKELGTFHKEQGTEVLLFIANWLASSEEPENCLSLQTYWLNRLSPMLSETMPVPYFVCCNRIGKEKETLFAGASCVIAMSKESPFLLKSAAHDNECIKMVELWL